MMDERLREMETRIEQSTHLPPAEREQLLQLLSSLRDEVAVLAESHHEDAHNVTHFLDASTHEISRAEKRPELLETALGGLKTSIENFEASHPKLFQTVQQFSVALANLGL